MLIPPVSLLVAWSRRQLIYAIPAKPDPAGLLVILGACLTFMAGKLGAEYFLSRVSIVGLLFGLFLTFWGAGRTRVIAFPLILLATMVPVPALVYNRIALPLQLLSSEVAATVLQFSGEPVFRDGNILHLRNTTLGVAEACSGLQSLASLAIVSLILGYAECSKIGSKILLLFLSCPFAIAVNVIRVTGTAFLANIDQTYALGFYHAFSGWVIFIAGFGFFWALAKALHRLLDRSSPHEGVNATASEQAAPTLLVATTPERATH